MINRQSPSLAQARSYIYSIDFTSIVNKLIKHNGWLSKDAHNTCLLYRNFLYLNKKYQQQLGALPPSEDIDEFWHNHILDTEKYERDCHAIFGRFFHHYPYLGIDDKTNLDDLYRAFSTTQNLYLKEFGEKIHPTKSRYPKVFYSLLVKIANY